MGQIDKHTYISNEKLSDCILQNPSTPPKAQLPSTFKYICHSTTFIMRIDTVCKLTKLNPERVKLLNLTKLKVEKQQKYKYC